MGSGNADVAHQVLCVYREASAGIGAVDGQFIRRRRKRGKGWSVGSCGIDGEVVNVGTEVLKAHLLSRDAAYTRHLDVVEAEAADAGTPFGPSKLEGDAHLLGVGLGI